MRIKRSSIFLFFIFNLVFILSYIISPFYLYGDQILYREIYANVANEPIGQAFIYYRSQILSYEVGHFLITWIVSPFLDKDFFVSLSNAALAVLSAKLLLKVGGHFIIVFVIVVLGYYSWALYLSAERLKFSVLFFIAGLLLAESGKRSYSVVLFGASVVTHLQSLLTLAVVAVSRCVKPLERLFFSLKVNKKFLVTSFFIFISFCAVIVIFRSHIMMKLTSYNQHFGIGEYLRMLLFFCLSLCYCKKRYALVIVLFLILFFFVFLVGGMRINMLGYFAFVYFGLQVRQGFNIGILLTSGYYLSGVFEYLYNTVNCGVNTC